MDCTPKLSNSSGRQEQSATHSLSSNSQKATARGLLAEIDSKAAELEPKERKALWDILTALRGPDLLNDISQKNFMRFKAATTAVVRFAALPLLSSSFPQVMTGPDDCANAKLRDTLRTKKRRWPTAIRNRNKHFFNHAKDAFNALGLEF